MSNYTYDFPDKSYGGLVNFFEHNEKGEQFSVYFVESFSSTNQLVNHTKDVDGSSVVHLLTGDTLKFEDIPKKRFAAVAWAVSKYFNVNS